MLEQTAIQNDGICARCKKRNESRFDGYGLLTELFLGVLLFPFLILGGLLRNVYRRITFPYQIVNIQPQINNIYPKRKYARMYIRSLIDGYFSPVLASRTGNPEFTPQVDGIMDGSRLLRKEIKFDQLPTRPVQFDLDRADVVG